MALHSATTLYGSCIELTGDALDVVKNMRRDVKYPLGKLLIDACTDLNKLLRRANMERGDKTPHIEAMLEQLEDLEFLSRTCRDRKHFGIKAYARIIGRTQSIGKQANGWKTKEQARHTQQPGLFTEPPR